MLNRSPAIGMLWTGGILLLSLSLSEVHGVILSLCASLVYACFYRHISLLALLKRARIPIFFAFLAAITLPIEISWNAKGLHVMFGSSHSFFYAFVVFIRSCSAIIATISLMMTERIEDMLALLARLRFPIVIVEVAFLIHAIIFELAETQEKMETACDSRLGFSTIKNRIRSTGMLASTLWLQALSQARAKQIGLAARGLESGAIIAFVDLPRVSIWEIVLCVAALGGIALLSWFGGGLFL